MGNPSGKCWTWTNPADITEHPLPGWETYMLSSSNAFFGANSVAVIGFYKAGGQGPPRIGEYSMDTEPFTLLSMQDFGDNLTRNPICLELASGGILVVGYQHEGPPIFLKTAYRRPDVMPPPPASALPSPWSLADFQFDLPGSEIAAMNYTVSQQVDGTIWLFMSRDGSGRFSLARFRENNGVIENIDFIPDYFSNAFVDGKPRDGDMSPGEELPPLRSTADPDGGRILLEYPQWGSDQFCTSAYEHNVITAVYPDLRRELVAKLPDMMWKFRPVGCAWPREGGVTYMVNGIDRDTCLETWRTGSVVEGVPVPDKPIKYAVPQDVSFCKDTHVAFNFEGLLVAVPAGVLALDRPMLTISKKNAGEVEISIEGGTPPFQLEICTDLTAGIWKPVGQPTSERTIIQPITGEQGFFRVVQVAG